MDGVARKPGGGQASAGSKGRGNPQRRRRGRGGRGKDGKLLPESAHLRIVYAKQRSHK